MPRTSTNVASRRRRKRILKAAKGYYGARHRQYIHAKETLMRGLAYAFRDRRAKKRSLRRLWIVRINASTRLYNLSYSTFINRLKELGIGLNRKILAEIAVNDQETFSKLVELVKANLV